MENRPPYKGSDRPRPGTIHRSEACGCTIKGKGTRDDPWAIAYCDLHGALRVHWEYDCALCHGRVVTKSSSTTTCHLPREDGDRCGGDLTRTRARSVMVLNPDVQTSVDALAGVQPSTDANAEECRHLVRKGDCGFCDPESAIDLSLVLGECGRCGDDKGGAVHQERCVAKGDMASQDDYFAALDKLEGKS